MKHITSGVVISVIGGLILWGIQSMSGSESKVSATRSNYQSVTLTISATNSDIEIHEGDSDIPYQGGVISSTGSDQIIYLPKGQPLIVNLLGTNSDLKISKSIADQISVNNSGTNSDVISF